MEVEDTMLIIFYYKINSYENIFVYNILHKKVMDAKPMRIRFDKVDGIIKIYDGIRYF